MSASVVSRFPQFGVHGNYNHVSVSREVPCTRSTWSTRELQPCISIQGSTRSTWTTWSTRELKPCICIQGGPVVCTWSTWSTRELQPCVCIQGGTRSTWSTWSTRGRVHPCLGVGSSQGGRGNVQLHGLQGGHQVMFLNSNDICKIRKITLPPLPLN